MSNTSTKDAARKTLTRKVRDGVVLRQPCEICGATPADAHHDDYDKPLEVRWLCRAHHAEVHRQTRGLPSRGRPRRPRRTPDTTLSDKLAELSALIRTRQQELRALEHQRNLLVHRHIAAGFTHAEVANATGLTRGRVGQIATAVFDEAAELSPRTARSHGQPG